MKLMKNILLLNIALFMSWNMANASDLISATPKDGIGNQIVSIHSCSGQASVAESAFNLLYNISDGDDSRKKWTNTSNLFPWVVFELTDIYLIDKIVFRDAKLFEPTKGNVPQYRIEVSLEHPDNCMWEEVALKKNQAGFDTKELIFDKPVRAKYVKFTAWRGFTSDGKADNAIRIYGLDMYGTLDEKIDYEPISIGKTVMGFNGASASKHYERPLNILDGNITNADNVWRSSRPSTSDSLRWVVIDLQKNYVIDRFKLFDAKFINTEHINISGYNVYLSTEMPDMEMIKANEDLNTCWTQVVDAYADNRLAQNIKTDDIQSTKARYIKLEVPRSLATGYIRIYQFEVFGKVADDNAISFVDEQSTFLISPNPVTRGEQVEMNVQEGLIRVYSLFGSLLKEQVLSETQKSFSTSGLEPGIYLVQYIKDKQTKSVKLIIK